MDENIFKKSQKARTTHFILVIMDITQLYQDFSVDFVTEGHKHSRPGWANTECPWCTGNPGYHLGYDLSGDYYYCWRCGWHPVLPTVAKLLNQSEREAQGIIRQYGLYLQQRTVKKPIVKVEHRLPSNVEPLGARHRGYLEKRGFDSYKIEREWNITGTGPISLLDKINFRFRLIIPIIWDNQQVSFTSRDVTDKSELRYITCPKDREIIEHKHILYGIQENWKSTGICCEGPSDCWRMGTSSFACFGIKYTNEQLRKIAKNFKRVAVFFDTDPQADIQAKKLVADLRFRGVDAFQVIWKGGLLEAMQGTDPGSLKQEDADYIVKQIIK